jgi:retron-type reverse transcriptase
MRTIPSGSYERLSNLPSLWRAYLACRRGKRRQARMATFDLDADYFLCALQRDLLAERYQPDPWRLRLISDPKTRLIAVPSIRDRVVHRVVLDDIGPHYARSFIEHSYTAADGRGPHRAVPRSQGWMRRYRYRLCLDIRRYFPSIHHPTLCQLLFRRLRDEHTRRLLVLLVHAGKTVYGTELAVQALDLQRYPLGDF